jgi:hypothetical protein
MTADETAEYLPPSSQSIADTQDSTDALRLLLAQRKLYSQSKRWLALRWLGMLVIALAAPPISATWPKFAVVAGAVASLWIFLGRTALSWMEQKKVEQAAAVQEAFDQLVFGMPSSGSRSAFPSLEEIVVLAGTDDKIETNATKAKLKKWYPVDASQRGLVTVAICQRANASYADRLLKATAGIWVTVLVVWVIALVVVGLVAKLSSTTFLLGIALPVLPAFLGVWEYWVGIRRAAADRRDLVTAIETKLANGAQDLEPQDVLVWQERLYDLRRNAPQVPDLIYRITRRWNEPAMETAAELLSRKTQGESQ